MAEKRGVWTERFLLLVIATALASISVHAQLVQSIIDPFRTIAQIVSQSKLTIFLGIWAGGSFIIWRIFNLVITWIKKQSEVQVETGGAKKGLFGFSISGLIFIVSAILSFYSVSGAVLQLSSSAIAFRAWVVFILVYTAIEVLGGLLLKEKETEEKERTALTVLCVAYFIVSILIAPFASIYAGSDIFAVIFVHMIIAVGLYAFGHFYWVLPREIGRKTALEEKERKKREEEHVRQLELVKARNNRNQDVDEDAERNLVSVRPAMSNAQTIAQSQPGNLASLYPFLASIYKALPANKSLMQEIAKPFSGEEQVRKIREELLARSKIIRAFKEDYSTTKPGREAAYVIQVIRDLRDDIANRRLAHWREYVGENWDQCKFADRLEEFQNPGYKNWQKIFRDSVKNGPNRALKFLKKRLDELNVQRKEIVKAFTRALENENNLSPVLTEVYQRYDRDAAEINSAIDDYNKTVESFNGKLDRIRAAIQRAADVNTPETQRTRLMVSEITPLFEQVIKDIGQIREFEKRIGNLLQTTEATMKRVEQTEKEKSKVEGILALLKVHYGLDEEFLREAFA